MSRKERLQNRYNTLNIYLGIALTSFVAVIGFMVASIDKVPVWVEILSFIGLIVVGGVWAVIQSSLNAINDEIERL